jgi:hypothetical protein
VTLPRSLQSEGIYCLGTCGASIDRVLARVVQRIEAGELSVDDAGDATADLLEADPLALVATAETRAIGSFVGVLAQGVAQGREETVIVLPGGPTDGSLSIETARPAAVAVGFLPDLRAGVHAPEAVLVPNEFLRVYAARYWDGVEPYTVDRQPGVLVDPSVFAPTRGRSST